MADQVPNLPDEADAAAALAAQQTAAGVTGVTDVDVAALIHGMQQQMAAMAAQISQLQAEATPSGPHPLQATARMLRHHLADAEHRESHAPAVALAEDLVEASGHAVTSGDLTHVKSILARLDKWRRRNPVPPGDAYHARQADEIIGYHLPDQVETFVPRPKAPAVAGAAPVPVITGSVVAG